MSVANASAHQAVRVAFVSGACVRHDAISYSLRLKLDLLRSLRRAGHEIDCCAFVQGTDLDDPAIRVRSPRDLLLDPEFSRANVVVYEYGIAYELFDSIFLLGDGQRSIGVYHNLTPVELIGWPEGRTRVEHGLLLRHNLDLLDHVACDSEFNRLDLVACGLSEERLSVLPLPPRTSLPSVRSPEWSVEPVEILFVGRLVRAKGVHDLLAARNLLSREGEHDFRLTFAGSARWSEPDTIEQVQSAADASSTAGVRLIADPADETLERLYRKSSILAIPSYHEGYCLPVLEAFHAGCQVAAYDAGNLPSIVADLGQLVPTGDVQALARALRRAIDAVRAVRDKERPSRVPTTQGDRDRGEWLEAVARHVESHSRERYERSFLAIFRGIGIDLETDALLPGAS